jgi:hypothetical protein
VDEAKGKRRRALLILAFGWSYHQFITPVRSILNTRQGATAAATFITLLVLQVILFDLCVRSEDREIGASLAEGPVVAATDRDP